jgi:hypothetical protein
MPDWTRKNFGDLRDVSPPEVDGQWRFAREALPWDVLRVAPAVVRSFEAGPDGLDVICIGSRRPQGGDTERFEDFWPDGLSRRR